jgi:predicted DNA-binding transcriptional regulator AlpA
MRKKSHAPPRRIGVLEFAEKLSCHPATIPRLVKNKKGFPQPDKLLNKNTWAEDVADAYVASLIKQRAV